MPLLLVPHPALALDGMDIEVHGFALGTYAVRTNNSARSKQGGGLLLAEERLRLDVAAWAQDTDASIRIKNDFTHDSVTGSFGNDLREAYLDYSTGDFDFQLGRQIVTWGVGDLLFINDVFPKDWVSFFSGRPLEYLKKGADGVRVRYSGELFNAELLAIPFFRPDSVPDAGRFSLFDPFAAVTTRVEERPSATPGNTELALRLYRRTWGFDTSLYAFKGFWETPSMRPNQLAAPSRVMIFYPRLSVFGASAQGNFFRGVLSLEAGYYDSRQDRAGSDATIPNSQIRFLAGYQQQAWEDATIGVQYYVEIMQHHAAYLASLPAGFPAQKRYRDTFTLRIEQLLLHQTLRLSLFAFYGRAEKDYLVRPLVSYAFSDRLHVSLGANIFGGKRNTTFLGQYDKDDNVDLTARYDF